jgi:DNA-binding NarL/FixJ family response regulator
MPYITGLPGLETYTRDELFSVLLVADHPVLREAISARLARLGAGTVHEARSAAEARSSAGASGPCDLAILDVGLPDGSGIELIAELRRLGWPRIVVLADPDDSHGVRAAFQAGAQAYLLKSDSPAGFLDGLDCAPEVTTYAAGSVFAPAVGARPQVPDTDNTPQDLSAREVEVLQRVADGSSNKEIGQALGLSALTVKSHLSRIGRKLATGDRAQMVALAMRAGAIR